MSETVDQDLQAKTKRGMCILTNGCILIKLVSDNLFVKYKISHWNIIRKSSFCCK